MARSSAFGSNGDVDLGRGSHALSRQPDHSVSGSLQKSRPIPPLRPVIGRGCAGKAVRRARAPSARCHRAEQGPRRPASGRRPDEVFVQRRCELGTTRQVDVAISDIRGRAAENAVTLHVLQFRYRHDLVDNPIQHGSHSLLVRIADMRKCAARFLPYYLRSLPPPLPPPPPRDTALLDFLRSVAACAPLQMTSLVVTGPYGTASTVSS